MQQRSVPPLASDQPPRVSEIARSVSLKEAHATLIRTGASRGLSARHLIAGIECGQFDLDAALVFLLDAGRHEDARRVRCAVHTYTDSSESTY